MSGSLRDGQILSTDLCDSKGALLLEAGLPVTEALIRRLADLGIREVYLDEKRSSSGRRQPLVPYDPAAQQQLEHNYHRITAALSGFIDELQGGDSTSTEEIEEVVNSYLQEAIKDSGVVLAACMGLEGQAIRSRDEALQRRSVRMSILATVAATHLRFSQADCLNAGIIGAIHDIALYGSEYSTQDEEYLEHPFRGIDLLQNTFGVTDQMRIIVGQVHEQCDGTGYPRQLKSARLHAVSRLLNVVDAYLTLIEPMEEGQPGVAPSDALAYLVQHALYGCFDRTCVQGLVAAASIYPVGTKVLLDDGTRATVVRSNGALYLQPIVQLDLPEQTMIDLRLSDRSILQPDESDGRYQRLSKSMFWQVLWRPAA
ncbi:MAG: HD domain-containing phosphohydrolase [Pirellulaceae bacterium]|nr:HD domain-containing phosphohydrolase [Pirellulaceae bacterium]